MPAEPKPPWDQWGQTTGVAAQSEPGKNKLLLRTQRRTDLKAQSYLPVGAPSELPKIVWNRTLINRRCNDNSYAASLHYILLILPYYFKWRPARYLLAA